MLIWPLKLFTRVTVHFEEVKHLNNRSNFNLLGILDILIDLIRLTGRDLLTDKVTGLLMDHFQIIFSNVFQFVYDSFFQMFVVIVLSLKQKLSEILTNQAVLICRY